MATGVNIKQLEKFIEKYFGKRCKEYCFGCCVCSAWRVFDDIKDIIEDLDDLDKLLKH